MAKPVKHRGKWRIRWTDERGQRHSEVYDDHKVATSRLNQHLVEVDEIKLGLRRPTPPEKTFDQLADYWIEKRVPQKRSGGDDESIIKRHLRPSFGPKLLRQIGIEDIDAFKVAKLEQPTETTGRPLGKKTLNNILTLFIAMMNAAVELGWLITAPPVKKPKVRVFSKDYSYLRTDDEVRRFLVAARDAGEGVFALYATAVYTGMREGELACLHWADVNFDTRLITVQRSWDGPTKAEDVRYVPILDSLLPVLKAWKLRIGGELCFPNEKGKMFGESAQIFQERFQEVLAAANFAAPKRQKRERHPIVFHDLRHTFASHWMMKGGDVFKLKNILGHKSIEMTMRYAHLAPHAYASDFARFGAAPAGGGDVVELPKREKA